MVEAAGYAAERRRTRPGRTDDGRGRRHAVRRLRRRLILALVFFVPLTDLSIVLSLFPGPGSPAGSGSWSRWPRRWRSGRRGRSTPAALRQARHGSSSMDTLVSLGIIAACGWSVYAMFVLDRGTGAG